MDWSVLAFVRRGKHRKAALKELQEPITPTHLSKRLNIHLAAASRLLLELEGKGLVICLTPNEKLGRLYRITARGKDYLKN